MSIVEEVGDRNTDVSSELEREEGVEVGIELPMLVDWELGEHYKEGVC
jgi:hypothetical protein